MSQAQNAPVNALEKEPVGKLLREYSIPAIVGMTITSLYNIVDSIFIGRGVGPLGLSALTVAFPLMNLLMALSLLVGAGGAAVTSIEMGRKNVDKAFKVVGHVIILSLSLGILFAIAGLLLLDPVLRIFGASSETMPYAREFMQIIMAFAPVLFLMMGLNGLMRASGYPRKAMLTSVFSVAVNIVLAPLFIFVFNWGIRGAALATALAQTLTLVWLFFHFTNQANLLHIKKGIFKLEGEVIKSIVAIGLAPFLMNVCSSVVVIFINLALASYGGDLAIGAYGIGNRVLMLFGMIILGISQGMQPIVGFNYGARRYRRVKRTLYYAMIAASAVACCGFLTAQLLPEPLARMFTDDRELIDLSVNALRMMSVALFMIGAQFIGAGFFQYIGMPKIAIFLSLSRQMVFLLPLVFILPHWLGLNGIWLSMPGADVISTALTVFILWWSLRKMGEPINEPAVSEQVNV